MSQEQVYKPKHHIRFVTASSLFDGTMLPSILCAGFCNQAVRKSFT